MKNASKNFVPYKVKQCLGPILTSKNLPKLSLNLPDRIKKINVEGLLNKIINIILPRPATSIHLNGSFPELNMDENKLEQVFVKLIKNAIKYNPKKLRLVGISGWSDNDFHYFDVADNGIGIEKKYFENIFVEPQIQATRFHVESKSTASGLARVKEILENIGGKINVRSKIGTGSLFQVAIPLAKH